MLGKKKKKKEKKKKWEKSGFWENVFTRSWNMGGGFVHSQWKWRTSATKHLRCRGLSVTNCIKKGGFQGQSAQKQGVFQWNASKNRGFQGQNGQKFLNILSNLSKFSKLLLVWPSNAKMRGLWVTKMCQGLSVTRRLLKIRGHWVKVGKNGGLSVKASEKSRVFLVEHGA